jgi:hypothetical protein
MGWLGVAGRCAAREMRTFLVTLFLWSICRQVLPAKAFEMPDQQCRIAVPDSWVLTRAPGVLFSAKDPQGIDAITVVVAPNRQNDVISPEFTEQMKVKIEHQDNNLGAICTVMGEGGVTHHGAASYRFQCRDRLADGIIVYSNHYLIMGNGKIYYISTRTLNSSREAELEGIVNSFELELPPSARLARSFLSELAEGYLILTCLGAGLWVGVLLLKKGW